MIVEKSEATLIKNKTEIIQNYVVDNDEKCSYNDLIHPHCYKIEICLNSLLSRKNMSFRNVVRKVDKIFLLEYLCVVLQELDLWSKKICNHGHICGILKMLNYIDLIK